MSHQDSKDWGGKEIKKVFFDFLDFTRQSINFNLFGNKEPKDVWNSVFSSELTTSDMDGLISHAFSNNTQLLNAFKSTKTPTHADTQGFNTSLEIALGLMEEFRGLNANATPVI